MPNIEYRVVIKFLTWKGLNATEISKELVQCLQRQYSVLTHTVIKCLAKFKESERAFEDSSRMGHSFTITTDQNIEAVERIVMCDRQIFVHRLAYELPIPTITVYEIMNNYLGMKKASIRWVRKLLTSIRRTNRLDCCQELLQES